MTRVHRVPLAIAIVGLLGPANQVESAPREAVVLCEVAKIQAAAARAACLADAQVNMLTLRVSDPAKCEAEFDAALTTADAKAAKDGAACRYLDTGDGTISDLNTLLQWEKKTGGVSALYDAQGVGTCLNCVNDLYDWTTAASEWLSALNGRTNNQLTQIGYAGRVDWRLPTIADLQTILLQPFPCPASPCVDPAFDNPTSFTAAGTYWSPSSQAGNPIVAWDVDFNTGVVGGNGKGGTFHVRAVRGGR